MTFDVFVEKYMVLQWLLVSYSISILWKQKRSQMWTSRKDNKLQGQFVSNCKGKNAEIQEIGSIRCTRSNKIAHRKCQCLTESLRSLLPFPLLLCSGGVWYTSHLVFPLWLEKHTLPLCFAVVSKEALLINSSGSLSISFPPFFSDFIWLGWRANSDLSLTSCFGCDLESSTITSPATSQRGFVASGTNQTTTPRLYLGTLQSFTNPVDTYLNGCCSYTHWSEWEVSTCAPVGPGTTDYDVTRGALHSLAHATGQSSWTGCLDWSLSPSSKNNFPLRFHPSFPTAPSKQNTPMAGLQT